ncbi:signal recognition particle-docking protein FtsY [archaeon]|nr:signal recognition particle-docking protein FtsY [archaeon]
MFGFLKKKFKEVTEKFSQKVEEESEKIEEKKEEIKEEPKVEDKSKKKEKKKKSIEEVKEENVEEEHVKEIIEEKEELVEAKPKEKKSLFKKLKEVVTTKKISEEKFEKLFEDLEITLMENNVALEVIDKIKQDLKMDLVNVPIKDVKNTILKTLKKSLEEVLTFDQIDLLKKSEEKNPFVILFVGVNGSGKTTTVAKLASYLLKNKKKIVMVAADTFRAAAIKQLEEHGDKLGVKVIKHDYGADPAAVAFDGVKHAQAKDLDYVLIDTAGRQHSNENLIDEIKKVKRVSKPDLTIFVGESITGNDCIEQIKKFNDSLGIDGVILSKADVDDKGGTAISVSYVSGKPILYIGKGQEYDDLEVFDKEKLLESFGF